MREFGKEEYQAKVAGRLGKLLDLSSRLVPPSRPFTERAPERAAFRVDEFPDAQLLRRIGHLNGQLGDGLVYYVRLDDLADLEEETSKLYSHPHVWRVLEFASLDLAKPDQCVRLIRSIEINEHAAIVSADSDWCFFSDGFDLAFFGGNSESMSAWRAFQPDAGISQMTDYIRGQIDSWGETWLSSESHDFAILMRHLYGASVAEQIVDNAGVPEMAEVIRDPNAQPAPFRSPFEFPFG